MFWRFGRVGLLRVALLLVAMCAGALPRGEALTLFSGQVGESHGGAGALPSHPGLVTGQLDNGLRYVIKPHAGTPGKTALRLIVRAGSLTEADDARGVAMISALLVDAASSANPAGIALRDIPGMEGMGSERVVTDFETARFTLTAPSNSATAIKTAVWRLADVARGAGLTPARVTELRPTALAALDPCALSQRLMRSVAPQLFPGSKLADHLPCPADELVCALSPEQVVDFVRTRYAPGEMLFVAVGDAPSRLIESYVRKLFSDLPAQEAPEEAPSWLPLAGGPRVIVVGDPELPSLVVELTTIDLAAGPVQTHADLRRRAVDLLAARTLQQRLRSLIDQGEGAFRSAEVWTGDAPGPVRMSVATITGEPAQMKRIVERVCREVAHSRYEGVSDQRLADASAEMMTEIEEVMRTEERLDVAMVMDRTTRAAVARSAMMSTEQTLELLQTVLPSITPDEVSAALSARFDLDRCAIVVLTPEEGGPALAESIRPLVEETLASAPTELALENAASSLLAGPTLTLRGDEIEEIAIHPVGGVTSVWLASGVRAHHRGMEDRPGNVAISVTIAGGRIQENDAERGLTYATVALWRSPATASRSSAQIRQIMLTQPVKLAASIADDNIRLSIVCTRENTEAAMQLLHLLLTEPEVEAPAFQRWRWAMLRDLEGRMERPQGALNEALSSALYAGDDHRHAPLDADEIRALQRSSVQAWLMKLVTTNPIECAIAGDISRRDALEYMARYLGSLAPRHRPGADTFCELRRLTTRPAPGVYRLAAPSSGEQSVVLVGMRGADPGDARSRLVLDIAARALGARLREQCVGQGLATEAVAQHIAAEAYPGDGFFYAMGSTTAARAEELAGAMDRELGEIASHGPSDAELQRAKDESAAQLEFRFADPFFWASNLSDLSYHAKSIDEIFGRADVIRGVIAGDVAEVMQAHDGQRGPDGRRLTIIVTPRPPEAPLENLATWRAK